MDKYELDKNDTTRTFGHGNKTLYRIIALKNFGDVKIGSKGGYVESEDNLSQTGNCWIYDRACVFGKAEVSDNAKIKGSATVFDNAKVSENAKVLDNAEVFDNAQIYGNSTVSGDAKVSEKAEVFDNAKVLWDAQVSGTSKIHNWVQISGSAEISGDCDIGERVHVFGNAKIKDQKLRGSDKISKFELTPKAKLNKQVDRWSDSESQYGLKHLQKAVAEVAKLRAMN